MSADKVKLDVTFFRHLVECIERQRILLEQPPEIRKGWQATIDMTVAQCEDIIKDKEYESLHEYDEESPVIPVMPLDENVDYTSIYLSSDG